MQPGDVVRLKSGSPPMTIARLDGDEARCFWFVGNPSELKYGDFPLATLMREV